MAMSPSGISSSGDATGNRGAGNDKTFVGFSCPRQRPLRRAMVSSSQSNTDSAALPWRVSSIALSATAIARRTMRSASGSIRHVSVSIATSTARACALFSDGGLFISVLPAGAERTRSMVVGSHDLCHQLVSYDILVGKCDAADSIHIGEQTNRLGETRSLAARQVHLAGVAGNDHAAVLAQPGQEHFHLHGGGVLRLVQDDHCVGERPTPHEGERCDLDFMRSEEHTSEL